MITMEEGITTVTTYSGASVQVTVYTVYEDGYIVIRTTDRRVAHRVYTVYESRQEDRREDRREG
jgi:hypothetical protein